MNINGESENNGALAWRRMAKIENGGEEKAKAAKNVQRKANIGGMRNENIIDMK